MAMMEVKLVKKVELTHDVFELHYKLPEIKEMKAGQFITFILPGVWGRSYSILELIWDIVVLIVKRWPEHNGGRWWSIILCDAKLEDIFKAVWPAGHFVLSESTENRLFLWTGTGLVPLFNMILEWLKSKNGAKYQLVFWVRYMEDMFYVEKFEALKKKFPDTFYYHLMTSRSEEQWNIKKWYITDFLSPKVVSEYWEYYLCGAPGMIEWCQEKLAQLWVEKEKVFFEKYS